MYSVKKTIKIEREKLCNIALSYSTLDAMESSDDTMKLVEEYVAGNMEILETVIEKYQSMSLKKIWSISDCRYQYPKKLEYSWKGIFFQSIANAINDF